MASRRTLAWCGALRDGPSASSVPPQDKRNWCFRRNRMILRNLSAAASALALAACAVGPDYKRSEEHTSELQSLMRISYAVFCLKQKTPNKKPITQHT